MSLQLRFLASNVASWTNETLPLVRPEDIQPRTGLLVSENRTNLQVCGGGPSTTRAIPGDILFCKLRPYLAKVVLTPWDLHASSELIVIRPRVGTVSGWLHGLLLSSSAIDWAIRTSDGAKMPRTSWAKLGDFEINEFPDLQTQTQIAEILDSKFEQLRLIEKKIKMIQEEIETVRQCTVDEFYE